MKRRISYTQILLLLLLLPVAVVFSGGNAESADTPEASPEAPAGESEIVAVDSIDEIRNELESIGIRTFRGSSAAVDFSLENLPGGTERLSGCRGGLVFLNFWATWCPPCREEMPSMERLQAEMSGRPFRILAVNVQEDAPTVAGFVEEFGYTFPILLDRTGQVAANYSVRGIPTSYFIHPDGTMVGMLVGTRYWDEPEVLAAMDRIVTLATE